jgi:mannose-6-phosphate isomerase
VKPHVLDTNQLQRFYRGGPRIAEFRQLPATRPDTPEDWVGSTTCVHGTDALGLSTLPDGRLVREAIEADPDGFLGPEHVGVRGADPGLLVKLLDAGERLPVHCHPGRDFARAHIGTRYGKTEAWVVIGTDAAGGAVHLGFRETVPKERLAAWVEKQEIDELLGALNRLDVRAGDVWLVPAGVPHAIGAGLLILELQEPTDLSVLLEWEGFPIDGQADGHLGLGFDVALDAVDRSAWTPDRLETLRGNRTQTGEIQLADAEEFFGMQWVAPGSRAQVAAGFAIVVALDGAGNLVFAGGEVIPVHRGQTVLVPYGAGRWGAEGDAELLVCRPPTPRPGW